VIGVGSGTIIFRRSGVKQALIGKKQKLLQKFNVKFL
jgi:hypothetical protein